MSHIEITLAANTVRALAMFVSTRSGSGVPNPNTAIHLRWDSDTTLRAAATNGSVIMFCKLFKDGDLLKNFYFPEDEQERTISILPTPDLMAALGKCGAFVTLSIGESICTVRSEAGLTSHTVPRLAARQMSLFDDMDKVPLVTVNDLMPAGQFPCNPILLGQMAVAAKRLGMAYKVASLARFADGMYGVQFGSDETLWFSLRSEIVTPAMTAGLPPSWVTGGGVDEQLSMAEIMEVFAEAEEEEQPALELGHGDEHAPAELPTLEEAEAGEESCVCTCCGTIYRDDPTQPVAEDQDGNIVYLCPVCKAQAVQSAAHPDATVPDDALSLDTFNAADAATGFDIPEAERPVTGPIFTHPDFGRCEQMPPTGSRALFRVLDGDLAGKVYECSLDRMGELRAAPGEAAA